MSNSSRKLLKIGRLLVFFGKKAIFSDDDVKSGGVEFAGELDWGVAEGDSWGVPLGWFIGT
jgi:hypothetical protein